MSGPIVHVVGARPNFPKAAPVLAALEAHEANQLLVHTGQHYDSNMSDVFFDELRLQRPDVNLGVGSGTHATQTAAMMVALDALFVERGPAMIVTYGDVNSAVAAALVAAKARLPLAHVEAGLRSFDMTMPEEVNRIVTDRLSDLLFATSPDAIAHLGSEGVPADRIFFVGNPMIDTLLANRHRFTTDIARARFGVSTSYAAATLHRPSNVDDPDAVEGLVEALQATAQLLPIVIPIHPRGREQLERAGLDRYPGIIAVPPLGYLDFMGLVAGAAIVITDSGGVQEETTVLGVPCATLRANTERPVTISDGTNRLTDPRRLPGEVERILAADVQHARRIPPLWDGQAGPRIARIIIEHL